MPKKPTMKQQKKMERLYHEEQDRKAAPVVAPAAKPPDPEWLHCTHYKKTATVWTVRPIFFTGRTIPCAVCPECFLAKLTPYDVCAGIGPHPFGEEHMEQYKDLVSRNIGNGAW